MVYWAVNLLSSRIVLQGSFDSKLLLGQIGEVIKELGKKDILSVFFGLY